MSPLPSQGPKKWAELLRNPCVLGSPKRRDKIRSGYITPCLLRGPRSGWNCYVTCVLGGPCKMGQNQKWLHHPCLLGAQELAELLRNPCILKGPHERGQNQKWLYHPLPPRGPKKWVELLRNLHSRGSPKDGTKSEVDISPLPSWGPISGRNWYGAPSPSGIPGRGDKIRTAYITPAFSTVPIVGKGPSGYITLAFLGFPIVGRHEQGTKQCLFSMQEWCLSIEPLSYIPPPQFWGLY